MISPPNSNILRVLYVGDLTWWGTCLQRMRALEALGCRVMGVDLYESVDSAKQLTIPARVMRKVGLPLDFAGVNRKIIELAQQQAFDILWLDKALLIKPGTIKAVKALQPTCKIIGYTPDDMSGNRNNQSHYFLQHLPLYDVFFTTKTYGVAELKSMGCPKVIFVGKGFDPNIHRPVKVSDEDKMRYGGSVGFIGAWEQERSASILALAQAGFEVRVWGKGWHTGRISHANIRLEDRCLMGEAYSKGICAFDINLGFLRKVNRDLQTQRSVEIPACGAFMLAERTEEHLVLFEEGKEAEYFDSDEELIEKVRYYLAHSEERKQIAAAGLERCLTSDYSIHERMRTMVNYINQCINHRTSRWCI